MATEFITRNYGSKEFEIIIKTDSKEHYKATEDFARRLIDHAKPKTNADRIRAMTDEELAVFMLSTDACDAQPLEKCRMANDVVCTACVMEWLKQPAED